MLTSDAERLATSLGGTLLDTRTLAGGFSHETCLLTLDDGRQVVARAGGADPTIEAAVMALAREYVPVPEVLLIDPAGERPVMVIEYVAGVPLSDALDLGEGDLAALGVTVGRTIARIGSISFDRPGFFIPVVPGKDDGRPGLSTAGSLEVKPEEPWSRQLGPMVRHCMGQVPDGRLTAAERADWIRLCEEHAPLLTEVDPHARLVHADVNPKNILVARTEGGWRVTAVLDWEFAYVGCPYGDAANMVRFGTGYPAEFVAGFRSGFAGNQPAGLPLSPGWARIGRVLDMFALSDLVTRTAGHVVADQAAAVVRSWTTEGVPVE